MFQPPELGVGVVYWPALDPLVAPGVDLVDVIEIEPQAFWRESGDSLAPAEGLGAGVVGTGLPALVHSVGCPVGGTAAPDSRQLELLRACAAELSAPWLSEHLSFNRVATTDAAYHALFLLPPRQSDAGVAIAASGIGRLRDAVGVPIAFETGVNYLRPRAGDLPDGEYVARVAEEADCGILLDLHNLLVNERNGRQPAAEVVAALPPERVWEIHVAGGVEVDGYWLDSHSGGLDEALVDLCREVIPALPNLGAVIFELLPVFIHRMGVDGGARELEVLRELWELRGSRATRARRSVACTAADDPTPDAWERSLSSLVLGRAQHGAPADDLSRDPGIAVYREQIRRFRRGMIADGLTMTLRLLLLTIGESGVERLLSDYWERFAPEPFVTTEARRCAAFLRERVVSVPYLDDVLDIELARLSAELEGIAASVELETDPTALLDALGRGRLPEAPPTGRYVLEVSGASSAAATTPRWRGAS